MDAVDQNWRRVSIGSEGQVTESEASTCGKFPGLPLTGGSPWHIPATRSSGIRFTYEVAGHRPPPIIFAAGEFSNGVWGFYVPK